VAEKLGALDPSSIMAILGKGVTPVPPDPLRDPNSLHSVVIDATAMALWVATAAPKDTEGKPDANQQPYRKFDFASRVTYPLTIRTEPFDADVFVDGESWGTAPLTKRVGPGQYLISFEDVDGYATPGSRIVSVGADGATTVGTYVEGSSTNQPGGIGLHVEIEGQGTVDQPEGPYEAGAIVELTARPAPCWEFAGWSGYFESPDQTIEFPLTGQVTLRAVFTEKKESTLTIEILGEGEVLVTPPGDVHPCGTEITLEAVSPEADLPWAFLEWRGDAESTDNPLTIALERDMTITAVFSQNLDVLTARETPAPCCGAPVALMTGLLLVAWLSRSPRDRR
jgi:hypothetical protein